jgi:hypothetical protein
MAGSAWLDKLKIVSTSALQCDQEEFVRMDLQRASFCKEEFAKIPVKLDVVNPDGRYTFNLAHPGERQIAVDLIKCVHAQQTGGTGSYAGSVHNHSWNTFASPQTSWCLTVLPASPTQLERPLSVTSRCRCPSLTRDNVARMKPCQTTMAVVLHQHRAHRLAPVVGRI